MLNFANRPWLVDIFKDQSDQIVIPKSSKTGITEWLIIDIFDNARKGKNIMSILPTTDVRNRFVTSRIDPIVARVPFYRAGMTQYKKDVDAKSLKTFFGSICNFAGSNSKASFYEFDADILNFDEFDQCDQLNLQLAYDRIGMAKKEEWRKVGNPTIAGFGIDEDYELSDKKIWFIKCHHCNEWQYLDWYVQFVREVNKGEFELIDKLNESQGDARAICLKCAKPIDRLAKGSWVAEHPDRKISGFNVSRLFGVPGNDHPGYIRPIIREEFALFLKAYGDPSKEQTFHNNRLGVVYSSSGNKITRDLIKSCVVDDYTMPEFIDRKKEPDTRCSMGVDVGKHFHVHVSKVTREADGRKIRRKVFVGHVNSLENVEDLENKYNVKRTVVDGMPELHMVRQFVKAKPGRFACFYNKGVDKPDDELDKKYQKRIMRANRTESMDASYADHQTGKVHYPKNYMSLDGGDFVKQMEASTRVWNEDRKVFEWVEGNKPDHHRHADNYDKLAADMMSGELKMVWL